MRSISTLALMVCLSLTVFGQKNIIKVGIPNVLYGEYQLGYERMLTGNQSIQLKAGYFQPVSSFLIGEDLFRFTEEYSIKGVDGGFQTSLEYRFYLQRQAIPSGFYISPYLRGAQLYMGYTDVVKTLEFDVAARFSLIGAGAQLGYQWLIGDHFCLDFNFFGGGVDLWMPRIKYTRDGYTTYSEIEPDIRNALEVGEDVEKYFNPSKRLTTTINTDNLIARIPFVLPGFRMGFSLGYAF